MTNNDIVNNADIVQEVKDIFNNNIVPIGPWAIQSTNTLGVYDLVDKDGCCIYQLSIPKGSAINSAERAGAIKVIEDSSYFLKILVEEYDRLVDKCIDLRDTITDTRIMLERSE
tara:strand:+ start:2313 stop:2654 length:342 start_codon:yes stop_codon:yes gene_type:complete